MLKIAHKDEYNAMQCKSVKEPAAVWLCFTNRKHHDVTCLALYQAKVVPAWLGQTGSCNDFNSRQRY